MGDWVDEQKDTTKRMDRCLTNFEMDWQYWAILFGTALN